MASAPSRSHPNASCTASADWFGCDIRKNKTSATPPMMSVFLRFGDITPSVLTWRAALAHPASLVVVDNRSQDDPNGCHTVEHRLTPPDGHFSRSPRPHVTPPVPARRNRTRSTPRWCRRPSRAPLQELRREYGRTSVRAQAVAPRPPRRTSVAQCCAGVREPPPDSTPASDRHRFPLPVPPVRRECIVRSLLPASDAVSATRRYRCVA